MPNSKSDALVFVEESRYALERFFEIIAVRDKALKDLAEQIGALTRAEENERGIFVDWGQWKSNANHMYGQYMRRVEAITEKREALATDKGRAKEIQRLLARTGATEHAIGIAAGAILQVGKQALSYRFGPKSKLPPVGPRRIGTQNVTEVIWEGRNHAMHWEEAKPGSASDAMLLQLQVEGQATITLGDNNAIDVLVAIGWKSADEAVNELSELVQL